MLFTLFSSVTDTKKYTCAYCICLGALPTVFPFFTSPVHHKPGSTPDAREGPDQRWVGDNP